VRKVGVDEGLRLAPADIELLRQTEGAHPVDYPEVDRLGLAALLVADQLWEDAEHLAGRAPVDVLAAAKASLSAGTSARWARIRNSTCE